MNVEIGTEVAQLNSFPRNICFEFRCCVFAVRPLVPTYLYSCAGHLSRMFDSLSCHMVLWYVTLRIRIFRSSFELIATACGGLFSSKAAVYMFCLFSRFFLFDYFFNPWWMRSSRLVRVRVSGCQYQSRYSPWSDPCLLRHSGIWGVVAEAVLNNVQK